MTKGHAYIAASRHFLTDEFPDCWENWDEVSDSDIDEFIDQNRWEPFEDKSTTFIWECIEGLAQDFQNYSNL